MIPYIIDRTIIQQRMVDGYIDATSLAKAYEAKTGTRRDVGHWLEQKRTKETLQHLSTETGIPVSSLIDARRGGSAPVSQGTWIHPRLAIRFGIWLSDEFGFAIERIVLQWVSGGGTKAKLPYHLERYTANSGKVPHTHFSILNELAIRLIAPLERQGYTLPSKLVPDISEGKMFCGWLRKEKGIEPDNFPTYEHEYEDGRRVNAKLYPIALYPDFIEHFHGHWLPTRALAYFTDRDKKALQYLPLLLPAPKK
jgi:hypothetical protein